MENKNRLKMHIPNNLIRKMPVKAVKIALVVKWKILRMITGKLHTWEKFL